MDRDRRPIAVLAHGSGSTGAFVRRAFGPVLAAAGWHLEPVEDRTGSVSEVEEAIADAVRATVATLVGGVSLGAHAAARWAVANPGTTTYGLLLVMPAWTGPADEVAAASAATAERIATLGLDRTLAELDDGSWVAQELRTAWPGYGSGLVEVLRATARSAAPTLDELAGVDVPAGVVGLRADPFHPAAVARAWAGAIPRAGHVELGPEEPARDVSALGLAALRALETARGQVSNR